LFSFSGLSEDQFTSLSVCFTEKIGFPWPKHQMVMFEVKSEQQWVIWISTIDGKH